MTPTQRLEQIISNNRPRVHGGMRGGFELLAGHTTAQHWKRKAAEALYCIRENRSALKAMGIEHKPAAARKMEDVRCWRIMAAAVGAVDRYCAIRDRVAS